ncbi:hypothetical protein [Streptomyces kanasensis]|uniref:hypothetical protein n=1 Tax=Streptomyces kanasensis TaxID=936756 RepID=UPI0038166237
MNPNLILTLSQVLPRLDQAPDPPPPDDPPAPSTYANSARVHPCSIRFNTPIQQGDDAGDQDATDDAVAALHCSWR